MRRNPFAALIPLLLVPRLAAPQGEPLGPEFRVNTYTPNIQGASSVAAAGNDFVTVWSSDSSPGSTSVFAQRFDSGGNPLGTEFRVNTSTDGFAGTPAVGANTAGAFVVVWAKSYVFNADVAGQRYDVSGAPAGPEFQVNPSNNYEIFPLVAVAPSGAFIIVWSSGGFGPPPAPPPIYDVFARLYDRSGLPQGAAFRVNGFAPYTQQVAGAVAADPAGNFVVVWSSQYSGAMGYDVIGQRYAASGVPMGSQFRVNTYTSGNQTVPAVATDPSGNFVVAWRGSAELGIRAQRFDSSGVPLGPEFQVNTSTAGTQNAPAIAVDGGGNFVITWADAASPGQGDIFGQRYSNLGAPSGPEFRVNTNTTDSQHNPSVASTAGGTFLVTWDSYPSVGDIFGQRFGGIFPVELQDFRLE
jgi:hypothetical protein